MQSRDDDDIDQDDEFEMENEEKSKKMMDVLLPGYTIIDLKSSSFISGHGTYVDAQSASASSSNNNNNNTAKNKKRREDDDMDEDDERDDDGYGNEASIQLVASVSGVVERVNKLLTIKPLSSRYAGEVGDVVIGRVTEVGVKRWKVNVGARQDAVLMLGSVNLPGGDLRRRTIEDQLQMRTLFKEKDVICAEVFSLYKSDGSMAIQTRSVKYGKCENGILLNVPSSLIRRLKQHFITLSSCNIDLIIGHNGGIWISDRAPGTESLHKILNVSKTPTPASSLGKRSMNSKPGNKNKKQQDDDDDDDDDNEAENEEFDDQGEGVAERSKLVQKVEEQKKQHALRVIPAEARERMARVRNSILILADNQIEIYPESITFVHDRSIELQISPKDMLSPSNSKLLLGSKI